MSPMWRACFSGSKAWAGSLLCPALRGAFFVQKNTAALCGVWLVRRDERDGAFKLLADTLEHLTDESDEPFHNTPLCLELD